MTKTAQPDDGYFIAAPLRAAQELLELLQGGEERDILVLNREGQREAIAILTRLLANLATGK